MSRLGKKPVIIPQGVEVSFDPTSGIFVAKGKLGEMKETFTSLVSITIEDGQIQLSIDDEKNKLKRSLWGTYRSLIQNAIIGVSEGFNKQLELNGVGYRMELGSQLTVYIGYSHPVVLNVPSEIKLTLEKNVLKGTSVDKQLLGNFFTNLHNMKPSDPYKAKGFKFPGRFYARKAGKQQK